MKYKRFVYAVINHSGDNTGVSYVEKTNFISNSKEEVEKLETEYIINKVLNDCAKRFGFKIDDMALKFIHIGKVEEIK